MIKKRVLPVVVIVLLLIGAGLLSRKTDEKKAESEGIIAADDVEVRYPRDTKERRRVPSRVKNAPLDTARAPSGRRGALAPIEAAMTPPGEAGVVFVELNAIRHSPIAEKILRCREEEAFAEFEDIKKRIGIDPSQDVDRLALSKDVVGFSGNFGNLTLPEGLGEGDVVGDNARVYETEGETPDGQPQTVYVAKVGDDLVLSSSDRSSLEASIARAQGTGDVGEPMAFDGANGELYGRFGKELLGGIFGAMDDPMAEQMTELVEHGVVRMNVDDHVSLSVDVHATDDESANQLAKTVGGAVAAARVKAANEGNKRLTNLLEKARVQPQEGGRFDLDLAVPGDIILDALGCDAEGNRLPDARPNAPGRAKRAGAAE